MAINFPNSPNNGDIYTVSGKQWIYEDGKWATYGLAIAPDTLKVDSVNNRVGVNNLTPAVDLDVTGNAAVSGNLTVDGNITVSGDTTTLNTTELYVEDNKITLNSGATGSATANAGIEVERGDDTNVEILWDETADAWKIATDFTVDAGTLHVDSTNNRVGIGTTSPASKADIYTDSAAGYLYPLTLSAKNASGTKKDYVKIGYGIEQGAAGIEASGLRVQTLRNGATTDALSFTGATNAQTWNFYTEGSSRMTIDSSGDVGINDTTPSYKLDVNGDINSTGNIRSNGVSITSNHGWHTRMLSADAITLTGSTQYVTFGYDDVDTDNYHDTTTNKTRIYIPSDLGGWYAISMRVAITSSTVPSLLTCFCRPNGNGNSTQGSLIGTIVPQAVFGGGGSVNGTIYLNGGWYIEMGVYATGGSNVSLLGTSTGQYTTVFHGVRVSP